jgi:aspartyl-tRNA(Asn)/glutamyl-tRNA(Gln) amidotransferase subunit B
MSEFETVIGLEVHLQFNTKTKIFCGCANLFGEAPNTLTCPVCLGLPGTLPVLNREVLRSAVKVALALDCKVNPVVKFDRKNYYYPDLPKGYQISQYDLPIAEHGSLMVISGTETKKVRIKRAHLEEDAGKLIHDPEDNCSLVDYNRTGTPLMEIVSEPDLNSPQEAYDYLRTLKLALQYLNVSDCDMEKGSLRCDANVSIRKKGASELGTKTELKNMNSFRAVKTALEFEIERHRKTLLSGGTIVQETRLWNEAKATTISMRSKEEAHDYRYFPEPDLVPFTIDAATEQEVRRSLPETPQQKFERFVSQYGLSEYDSGILIQDQELSDFFEKCVKLYQDAKKVCNWIAGPLLQEINARKTTIRTLSIQPQDIVFLITKVEEGSLSNLAAKEALKLSIDARKPAAELVAEKGLIQVSDEGALDDVVQTILNENEGVVAQIKEGKESAMGFLIGQAMKRSQGKANPKKLGEIIRRRIQDV